MTTIPASVASIHSIFSKHLADLEAAGERPSTYVYRFDNGTCLNVDGPKATIVGLLQASRFGWEETESRQYVHILNGKLEATDVVSFRLARKLEIEKLRGMLAMLETPVAA